MSIRSFEYVFGADIPIEEVQCSLLLSILACESLHGETEVHLNGSYRLDPTKNTCVVDVGTPVGEDLNRLFAGFVRREFGRGQFTVTPVEDARLDLNRFHSSN